LQLLLIISFTHFSKPESFTTYLSYFILESFTYMAVVNFVLVEVVLLGLAGAASAKQPRLVAETPTVRSSSAGFSFPSFITAQEGDLTLYATTSEPDVIILDYGRNVEGIPGFEVVDTRGETSVFEVTYAESRAALSRYMVCQLPRQESFTILRESDPVEPERRPTSTSRGHGHVPCQPLQHHRGGPGD
jgi:hypothetical protein